MEKGIVALFCELVRIDSESGDEARFLKHLAGVLKERLHARCEFDDYGNLIACVDGLDSTALPVLLGAHGDTVKPGCGIEPLVENGVVRSSGTTILGADDKAAIAEIVEAVRTARCHPPLEIVVTVGEEVGLLGARNLDLKRVRSRRAFIVDGEHLNEVVIG
ncbi:MAG: M28 family peptidase, partial [Candidatus Bipolaricaulota bacterium]|nr:M28 family peptidase [Candidatus Bipolaricaulota bacterium]